MVESNVPSGAATRSSSSRQASAPAVEIKGSVFTLGVVHLYTPDLAMVARDLATKLKRAPRFFRNAPMVIDLHNMSVSFTPPDFSSLAQLLRDQQLVPVGIRNGTAQQQEAALAAGLAVVQGGRPTRDAEEEKSSDKPPQTPTKLITQPVRSGQQIYAQGGDLVVLAPVSAGAELLADGHIHVYAPLRGRALAGIQGDETARIFCQNLEAELISVAGHYRVIEDLDPNVRGRPAQAYLEHDRLTIKAL